MATNDDKRRELLKIRQGLTEVNELPRNETKKASELNAFERVENFFYYYKKIILIGICVAAVLAFLIIQTVTREKEDLRVILISTDYSTGAGVHAEALTAALEQFCPDFDENGKAAVNVVYIDLAAGEETGEYYLAQTQKYSSELFDGTAQMIITDEGIAELFSDENGFYREIFIDFSEKLAEEMLFENCGIRLCYTPLAEKAGWADCPESVFILIRQDQNGNPQKTEQRTRAETVLQNILAN